MTSIRQPVVISRPLKGRKLAYRAHAAPVIKTPRNCKSATLLRFRRHTGRLIIMVKEPRLGTVKTRLGREIGAVAATEFYRCTTANLIRRLARDRRWATVLGVAPASARTSPFWPRDIARQPQGGGDIGERMARLLSRARGGSAVLVGSDIPGIRASHIAEAFALLRRHRIVFGPAEDGGFWLIGVNAGVPLRDLFDGVRWSTPHALADTLKNMSGPSAGFAAKLPDVDDAASYRRMAHAGTRVTPPSSPAAR
jgi:rSAM/selenodomain-associated transferase 1